MLNLTQSFKCSRIMIIPVLEIVFLAVMIAVSLLSIASCQSSTESKTGSLTGRILLVNDTGNTNLDPMDYSGITVSVYPLAVGDSTITRLNNQYPGIGMLASQMTEFDHRTENAIVTCLTQADGSFSLQGLNAGQYNVVAMKSDWGFRYIYNVSIGNGSNVLTGDNGSGSIALYPEQKISGYINSENVVVKNYHHLVIEDNTYILEGSSLAINPGATVRINPGMRLEIMGSASIQGTSDSLITFVSNDDVFSTQKSVPDTYDRIKFHAGSSLVNNGIEYVKVLDSISGLSFFRSYELKNSILHGANDIVTATGSVTDYLQASISNCVFMMGENSPNYDINLSFASPVSFEKNIVMGNNGLACRASGAIVCTDNYVSVSTIGLYFYDVAGVTVKYNDVVAGTNAIFSTYKVTSTIAYNNITAMDGLFFSSFDNIATANNNNLYSTRYAITYLDTTPEHGHLPAQNNWFGTVGNEQIQALIRDKTDYSTSDPIYSLLSYVDFIPFRTSKQPGAGVRI